MTGGSNGIGKQICLELATHGCHVAILDVDIRAAKVTCIGLKKIGVKAFAYKVIFFVNCGNVVIITSFLSIQQG